MPTIQCPGCDKALEASGEFELLVCPRCGQSVELTRKSKADAKPPSGDLIPEPKIARAPEGGKPSSRKQHRIPAASGRGSDADDSRRGKGSSSERAARPDARSKSDAGQSNGAESTGIISPVPKLHEELRQLLPPKAARPMDLSAWLPPAINRERFRQALAGRTASAFDVQTVVEPEFEMEEKRVGYVEFQGEKIAYTIPNPRARWRYRAAFNLVAMLVCLIVLYLAFLLIAGR